MRIKLTQLKITNFKGIKSFEINFDFITSIYGANASGKTSVFDAFLWLFFGKNAEDKTKFEVKPLDASNNFIKDLETEVEAIIMIDDSQEIAVKKVLRQKWVTPKASTIMKYDGDNNTYFWNDVPLKETEFKTKIQTLIGDEELFKLITNPFYFNGLEWQKRRNILMSIAGDVSMYEVLDKVMNADNKMLYDELVKALTQKKTLADYQAEISAKKKKIVDERKMIAPRIDEVKRGKPLPKDFSDIRKQVAALNDELNTVAASLSDEQAKLAEEHKLRTKQQQDYNDKVQAKQRKLFDYKNMLQNIEFELKQKAKESGGNISAELRSAEIKLADLKLDETKYSNGLQSLQQQLTSKNADVEKQYEACDTIEAEVFHFDETKSSCPTCKQTLPEADVEKQKEILRSNFNNDKIRRYNDAVEKGKALNKEIELLEQRITNGKKSVDETKASIAALQTKIEELKMQLSSQKSPDEIKDELLAADPYYQLLKTRLAETEALEIKQPEFSPLATNQALKDKQLNITGTISQLQRELMVEDQIKNADTRITQLTDDETKLSKELAKLEGIEFAILEFTKAKMEIIDQRINNKFRYVRFKMFDRQTNGQEVPTCQTLINSNGSPVPFDSANNAARINAGIDIINALSNHYNVYAPVFVDNAESITDIIDLDSQLVRLIVVKHAKLSVNEIEYADNYIIEEVA